MSRETALERGLSAMVQQLCCARESGRLAGGGTRSRSATANTVHAPETY